MTFQTFTFAAAAEISFDFGDFNATEVTVAPITEAAREVFAAMFGAGVVSVNVPKSQAPKFADALAARGLAVGYRDSGLAVG